MKATMATVVLCLLILSNAAVHAETTTLKIVADDGVALSPGEEKDNSGASPRLKLKSNENYILLQPDAAVLKNKTVIHAVLKIRATAEPETMTLHRIGVSTISADWQEGSRQKEEPAAAGDLCFLTPSTGSTKAWSTPGSTLLDVIFGRGGSISSEALVVPAADNWLAIEIDPRILESCAAGLSCGFLLADNCGQAAHIHPDKAAELKLNFGNNFLFSREQQNSAPYLEVEYTAAPVPDAAVFTATCEPWSAGSGFDKGAIKLTWPGPKSDHEAAAILGYRIALKIGDGAFETLPRWRNPTARPQAGPVTAYIDELAADSKIEARIELIGRGGFVCAQANCAGQSSSAFPEPPALASLPQTATAAAKPLDVLIEPDLVRINPISGALLEKPAAPHSANPVFDGSVVTLKAARGEFAGFQIVIVNPAAAPLNASITAPAFETAQAAAPPLVRLYRAWYIQTNKDDPQAWFADPLLPLANGAEFQIPDRDNAVPGQKNQTVYVEVFIPREAKPGTLNSTLTLKRGKLDDLVIPVKLEVVDATIPQECCFQLSFNDYFQPASTHVKAGDDAYWNIEHQYYAMAHEHRGCLALVPYSHSGRFAPGFPLPLAGSGKDKRVADWSGFDKIWGPLLDGSAFKGTQREAVPLEHFMLPFFENWPAPMTGYKWNDLTFEQHWKQAGPIAQGFSAQYCDEWRAMLADVQKHFIEKGWNRTAWQVFLNNKYFYKQYRLQNGKPVSGGGTSFWLFDEPQTIDDFLALEYFGRLFRSFSENRSPLLFRTDVSRPQYQRDALAPEVDLYVCSNGLACKRLLWDWRERYGTQLWEYGGITPVHQSAYNIVEMLLNLYAQGFDGYVPAESVANNANWTTPKTLAAIYTGAPRGIPGPCSSLRLKAFRRGEQDIELLRAYCEQRKLLGPADPNRRQVARLLEKTLDLSEERVALDEQGGSTASFKELDAFALEEFRLRLLNEFKPR